MKMRKLGRGEILRPGKRFGPLLQADKNDGGRGRSDYNMAAERARTGMEGANSGCVRYSESGLAIPCDWKK